jgi:hypothetical protein
MICKIKINNRFYVFAFEADFSLKFIEGFLVYFIVLSDVLSNGIKARKIGQLEGLIWNFLPAFK